MGMKALILAGGFATRMGELGKDTPKPLLPVAGRAVIEHIIEKIEPLAGISEVFVSTNKKFEGHFTEWMKQQQGRLKLELVVEPAAGEGKKLGSMGALDFFINDRKIDDDLLVINGDNIFEDELGRFLDFCERKGAFVFGVHDTKSIEESRKMGVVLMDGKGRVTDFEEKPENPKSTLVSTGIYVIPRRLLRMVGQYVKEGNSTDRFGDFLIWLMGSHTLYALPFEGRWFDIGTPDTYRAADEELRRAGRFGGRQK
jgi:glucose-1-phosphate thymidylyltransferase